ncbi:NUDIX domain-containing protein [Lysobacter sp. FW306-1B-D06B]
MSIIRIACAVILDDTGRMLLVRKHDSNHFIQPGGKIEASEQPRSKHGR